MAVKEEILAELSKHLSNTFPDILERYKKMFANMNDKEISEYFTKKKGKIRLYVDDDTISQEKVDKLCESTGVLLEERLMLPYKSNITRKHKCLVMPMQILKLQQMATKENASVVNVSQRDMNNQATRGSKTGLLSDDEVSAMAAYGSDVDPIIKELFSPRGDNRITKKHMNEMIRQDLDFSLADLPNGSLGRMTLLHLDANYACMGIATDLIDHIDERS